MLSASEISHDQSEKYVHLQFFGGFFTIAKNDVFIFYVILSASEISYR